MKNEEIEIHLFDVWYDYEYEEIRIRILENDYLFYISHKPDDLYNIMKKYLPRKINLMKISKYLDHNYEFMYDYIKLFKIDISNFPKAKIIIEKIDYQRKEKKLKRILGNER